MVFLNLEDEFCYPFHFVKFNKPAPPLEMIMRRHLDISRKFCGAKIFTIFTQNCYYVFGKKNKNEYTKKMPQEW